jgi:hypothetical protein
MDMASVANRALFVAEPAAAFWHWPHQHWRTQAGSAEIAAVTAPQLQLPV